MLGQYVPLQYTCFNVQVICVSIWWADFYFRVFIQPHYGCDGFFWGGCRQEVFSLSSLLIWSQMPWRIQWIILLPQGFFAWTPSRIWQIVKICDIVDRFFWKPFWFFLSIFLIFNFILLGIVDLGHYSCKSYNSVVHGCSEVTLLRKREDAFLCPTANLGCHWNNSHIQKSSRAKDPLKGK